MKIHEGANVNVTDLQIQQAAQFLYFNLEVPAAGLYGVMVGIKVVSRSGSKPLIEPQALIHLLDQDSAFGGHFELDGSDTKELRGLVMLSKDGAIDLNDGEYLSVTVTGLTAAGTALDIYTIDDAAPVRSALQRIKSPVTAGIVRNIDLASVRTIAIPYDKFEEIEFQYPAKSVTFGVEELKAYMHRVNDVVYTMRGLSGCTIEPGYGDFIIVDVKNALRLKIVPAAGAGNFDVILLKDVNIGNL